LPAQYERCWTQFLRSTAAANEVAAKGKTEGEAEAEAEAEVEAEVKTLAMNGERPGMANQ